MVAFAHGSASPGKAHGEAAEAAEVEGEGAPLLLVASGDFVMGVRCAGRAGCDAPCAMLVT